MTVLFQPTSGSGRVTASKTVVQFNVIYLDQNDSFKINYIRK